MILNIIGTVVIVFVVVMLTLDSGETAYIIRPYGYVATTVIFFASLCTLIAIWR